MACCAANSPPAPAPICRASSLPHAATVARLAACPVSFPAAISSLAGRMNLPARPIDKASKAPTINPRLAPFSLISSTTLGSCSALATLAGSIKLMPLSCKTSAMTEVYSIAPDPVKVVPARTAAPAGARAMVAARDGAVTSSDSASMVKVALGLRSMASAASPYVLAPPIASMPC